MKHKKWLSLLVTVAMAMSLIPATVLADDDSQDPVTVEDTPTVVETVSLDDTSDDSEELFEGFVYQEFGIEDSLGSLTDPSSRTKDRAGDALEGNNRIIYDTIVDAIDDFKQGNRTDTSFEFTFPDVCYAFSDFGAESLTSEVKKAVLLGADGTIFDSQLIISALVKDYPFDMFWFSKTMGLSLGGSVSTYNNQPYFVYSPNIVIQLGVYPAYRAGTNEYELGDIYNIVLKAAHRAQTVVNRCANYSDINKLRIYKEWICNEVSYDTNAAEHGSNVVGGDPWQLIYVFDEDPNTNVVCEGYSKAFQYLCDQTTFESDKISCYIVSGSMDGGTGAGLHMWNMVTLEDGKHYLVDVTNCDAGTAGAPDKLFLRTYDSKQIIETTDKQNRTYTTTKYTYSLTGMQVDYWYNFDTEQLYDDELLAVAGSVEEVLPLNVTFRHSCSFGTNLSINYYVEQDALDGYSDIKLVLWKYGKRVEIPASTKTVDGTAYYHFRYSGIAAHEMGINIKAVLEATRDGINYASAPDNYSVKTYAYNMLGKSGYAKEAKFKTLLVDMLNYGAAAQQYIRKGNVPQSNIVNADLTSDQKALATQSTPSLTEGSYYVGEAPNTETASFTGISVTLDSSLALSFYFKFSAGQSTDNVYAICEYTSVFGDTITKTIPFSEAKYNPNYAGYAFTLKSISACDVRSYVTITIYDGDTKISYSVKSSISYYAKSAKQKYADDELLVDLIDKLMKYSDSAKAYFVG